MRQNLGLADTEDKVCAIISDRPGDGTPEHPPAPLVTNSGATMGGVGAFGKRVHLEAGQRGSRHASVILVMGEGGNWIDPLNKRERLGDQRIVDDNHASEHLHE